MKLVGFDENLILLKNLFPDRVVISLTECSSVLGVDYRTVKDLTERIVNPLPTVKLTDSDRSKLGVPVALLARWLCKKEI